MPPSSRISSRRGGVEAQSVGLEDELSFGSDEDLIETIGEIHVPDEPHDSRSIASVSSSASNPRLPEAKASRTFGRSRKDRSGTSTSKASLASTTHLLPPLPPVPAGSTLDLPANMFTEREKPGSKRGSIMGAFKSKSKGLRSKFRDDQSSTRSSLATDSQSISSNLSLSKFGSNASSRPSVSSSFAHTPTGGPSPSSTVPHLGPLTFDPSSDPGFHSELKQPPVGHNLALHNSVRKADTSESRTTTPSPASSVGQKAWSPKEVSSPILPRFPATLGSLKPITVFSAEASKRPSSTSRTPFPNRWTPCTLVFTQFKVSLNGEDSNPGDDERTVAHVHVYSKSAQAISGMGSMGSVGSAVRRSRSTAGFNSDSAGGRIEIERRWLSRSTTASVYDDAPNADGRSVVMRILWGDDDRSKSSEWVVEMKDARQLHEWIRQIQKTAIMINAEELGYGHAIRAAFETRGVSADELALQLSSHARAVADGLPGVQPSQTAGSTGAASQEERRRPSLDATQGASLARCHSASEVDKPNGSAGLGHRSTGSNEKMGPPQVAAVDWFGDANGNTNGGPKSKKLSGVFDGLNLGLAFPTPPSDLPPPRPLRNAKLAPPPAAPPPAIPPINRVSADDDSDVLPAPSPTVTQMRTDLHLRKPESVHSETPSQTSSTSHLRRLRGKPQVVDIMAEFSAIEAENMPPEEDEEPIREDRSRRIRFAEA
ncbi:hypothetical protein CspHIS471_0303270 [Cutaneotrichosporon sp. HIS471]|nr:hypothetical protein CspHIS471_0303270 [Cutaneotrichosporon sp. HIS471]